MGRIFLHLFPFGKAGGHQIRLCQGIAVADYSVTLGALALSPSGFCNIGVQWDLAPIKILWSGSWQTRKRVNSALDPIGIS